MRQHELILVFYRRLPAYYPQMKKDSSHVSHQQGGWGSGETSDPETVSLFRYFVRTFSNFGEVVFVPFRGSGTTAIAAMAEERHFVGFEKEAS